ncbi:hypothetical protein EBU94_05035 [bacterium]|nr:hypothetical protein [bacterium]
MKLDAHSKYYFRLVINPYVYYFRSGQIVSTNKSLVPDNYIGGNNLFPYHVPQGVTFFAKEILDFPFILRADEHFFEYIEYESDVVKFTKRIEDDIDPYIGDPEDVAIFSYSREIFIRRTYPFFTYSRFYKINKIKRIFLLKDLLVN